MILYKEVGGTAVNERLKQLRKSLNMTLEAFGKKLGVTKTAISRLEKGERNLTEQMILAICREFNVNENWLRTGSGEMYDLPEDETAAIVSDLLENDNPFYDLILSIIKTYQQLDNPSQRAILDFSQKLLNNLNQNKKEG